MDNNPQGSKALRHVLSSYVSPSCYFFRLQTGQQAPSLSERAALDVIDALQQELVAVKLREAETHVTVKDMREGIQELEDVRCLVTNSSISI